MASPLAAAVPTFGGALADHAVLQRDRQIVIEGSASPRERLSIAVGAVSQPVTADASGHWRAVLPPHGADAKPIAVRIANARGEARVVNDILFGDVWLCAGQSNMEMQVIRSLDSYNQIKAANDPLLRLATVPKHVADTPARALAEPLRWNGAAADTVGDVSAVCYYMARALRAASGVPVGAIVSAWGGTQIKFWLAPPEVAAMFPGRPAADAPREPTQPASPAGIIYNAMIAPLGELSLSGVAWYQGESDVGVPGYRNGLAALAAGWRRQFARADWPLLIVGLANYGAPEIAASESAWAELREEQRQFVLGNPRAGLITALDLGERTDIHPANKQLVGARLAAISGLLGVAGPQPLKAATAGDTVRITYVNAAGGLRTWGGHDALGFQLCGSGAGSCRFAHAVVDGPAIVIAGDGKPASRVRYAWADSPSVNLYDTLQTPAGPFEIPIDR